MELDESALAEPDLLSFAAGSDVDDAIDLLSFLVGDGGSSRAGSDAEICAEGVADEELAEMDLLGVLLQDDQDEPGDDAALCRAQNALFGRFLGALKVRFGPFFEKRTPVCTPTHLWRMLQFVPR